MRLLLSALALSAVFATAASAQDTGWAARDFDLWRQQQLANQRAVALENQLNALEARQQTEARLRELEAQRATIRLHPDDARPTPNPAASLLPSNIDAWMAASNARVRAAAENRR
ncbi:hypothetical protein [Phenylobacterium sp.]|uniref:hypothetical protein n=1 Tax=Phenylobacterium sp. TaxID=1871053 RepID=UPI003BAC58F2